MLHIESNIYKIGMPRFNRTFLNAIYTCMRTTDPVCRLIILNYPDFFCTQFYDLYIFMLKSINNESV